MKKSIFLFFAAILCATNAWGAKLFFDHSSVNYPADGALVAIWSWGGSSSDAWSVFKASGATNKIVADIADGRTGGKIVRFQSSVTKPDWNAAKWNETGDISFPSDKNCIKITSWDGATTGTWSTFQLESQASITPSASSVSVGEEVTFTPALTSNQEYNDVLSTTYSVGAGATITDGKFVATEAGTYTVTATVTYNAQGYTNITKTATATCSITVSAVAVPHPVTGVTVAPTSVTIKQGATTTLTATVAPSNADDPSVTWSSDNQSVATVVNGVVTAVAVGTANITVTTVDGGFTATCAVKVKPLQYTFYAINSAKWPTVAAHYWGGADGGSSWPGADMVKESETINGFDIYSITISSDFINIMFTNQLNGDDKNKKTTDLTTEGNDGKYYDIKDAKWYASLSEVPVPFDYYVIGTINGWALGDANYGMKDDNKDGVYEKQITLAAGDHVIKVNDGTWDKQWQFSNLTAIYVGVTEGTNDQGNKNGNIAIHLDAETTITIKLNPTKNELTLDGLTIDAPVVTYDYYVVGSLNGWAQNDEDYGMSDEDADGVYEKEVTLVAGSYQLKVKSDGNDWYGYANVEGTYVEVSEAETDGNVELTLDAEKTFTVLFNSTTKKIAFEGLTVPTPTYTVTVSHNTYSYESITTGGGEYEEGATATVTASENVEGWVFLGWTENGEFVANELEYAFTVEGDIELVATYAQEMEAEEITNLVVDWDMMVLIGGPSAIMQVDVFLGLSEYDDEEGYYLLSEESSVSIMGQDATWFDGMAVVESETSATAIVIVEFEGMYYSFTLNMSAAPAEPIEVVVENATVTLSEYESAYELTMVADWTYEKEGLTYEVECLLPTFDPTNESGNYAANFYVRGDGAAFGMAEGANVLVTVENQTLKLTGEISAFNGNVYNVTISGTLPSEEPEVPTALDNVDTAVAPAKVINNGQLIIIRNGVQYNAQGAVVK